MQGEMQGRCRGDAGRDAAPPPRRGVGVNGVGAGWLHGWVVGGTQGATEPESQGAVGGEKVSPTRRVESCAGMWTKDSSLTWNPLGETRYNEWGGAQKALDPPTTADPLGAASQFCLQMND